VNKNVTTLEGRSGPFLVKLAGIEPDALPGILASEQAHHDACWCATRIGAAAPTPSMAAAVDDSFNACTTCQTD